MRTTVTIEDALYEKALELADPTMDKSEIFREAMRGLLVFSAISDGTQS